MSLSTGTKLGRYEVRSTIGAGRMGEVYLPQAAARSEGDQNFYESKCAALDRQIDRLVYEQIAIVERSTR